MIGQRIKQARVLANNMTQADLATKVGVTKQAISKYETGISTPSTRLLLRLADALDVSVGFLISEQTPIGIEWFAYRKRSTLTQTNQAFIQAYAEQQIENHLALEEMLSVATRHESLQRYNGHTVGDAETIAEQVREHWELDDHPISSIVDLVEDRGMFVIELPYQDSEVFRNFDGLCGKANGSIPVMVINNQVPTDRIRFNIAHELGHLVIDTSAVDAKTEEKIAHRFAAAFLVPAAVAHRELGYHRTKLDLDELGLLKQKYGLSIAGWIHRARDLEIISESHAKSWWTRRNVEGWRTSEPFELAHNNENPKRFRQLVRHAYAEKRITAEKARQLDANGSFEQVPKPRSLHPTALDLLKMPKNERDRYIAEVLSELPDDEDFEVFEAFDAIEDYD